VNPQQRWPRQHEESAKYDEHHVRDVNPRDETREGSPAELILCS
jgi:hypothetical protein